MKQVILLFLIWRIALFFIAAISPIFIPEFGAKFPYFEGRLIPSGLPHFLWSQGNFDGVHYIGIAQDGYAYQFTQAFFPLYPMVVKAVSFLTLGNFVLAGIIVSNGAFLAALLLFYKLVRDVFDEKTAHWSIIFLLVFPTSFYFGAIYTESLFFLLVISSIYLAQKKHILASSVIGAFTSATRLVGVFLIPALIYKKDYKSLWPLLIVPIGIIVYMIYLKIEFNNPLYFLTSQSIFGQERSTTSVVLLPQVIYRYIKILVTTHGLLFVNAAFELLSTFFALIVLALGFKKIDIRWIIFSALVIITPTLTGTFASMPRYVLVAFPIYIVLALIKSTAIKIGIVCIFALLLTIATVLFSQGYWVA